ncbi:Gfo/Idh/MocA family protein [Streptomyces sp. ISL-100]|uniref:Gfo/Idh/MocA family protein n=1 Tax=Streptomyces sp. ISL-100 TaxID=2819173 RepID=UPI001BE9FDE4|nr:Gfo/Idh/MocA family oxidoreductase [Streptomyces sp. ISL-100]MBT2395379.1 Gfo/Idh/MocA family oxidoreductase [Streptomyces sp. ISL-100]
MGKTVNVGIIGGGLMGKEITAAIARWPALIDHPVTPKLTAVCDINPDALAWFDRIESVTTKVTDYRDLLADDSVDVLYIAVRHDLHEQIYLDAVAAGKDFLAEKPFGIDLAAAERIVAALRERPEVFVRCSSEIPFFPGAQAAINVIRSGALGRIIEASNYFCHSSDLDTGKAINWKRQREYCGEAGVMNDLGMHVLHVPIRLGWAPSRVFSVLQDLVPTRPGPDGTPVACDTYENATLHCASEHEGEPFPLTLGMKRVDPGQKNTWSLRVTGMSGGVEFSTKNPKALWVFKVGDDPVLGREQIWQQYDMGSQSVYPTVTGGIFETGFSDAILQMWAAFLAERAGEAGDRFGCVTPEEALTSHRVFAAALRAHESAASVEL